LERYLCRVGSTRRVPDWLIIDLTIVSKLEAEASIQAIGRSKGGRTTEIHVVSDGMGRPCAMLLTPGNTNDHKVAVRCLEAMPPV
jgi:hypothetical protein